MVSNSVSNPASKPKEFRFTPSTPSKPIGNYPRDSMQKIAVLFTDIVASSNYFKSRGDIAGRKMLKLHQDMVSPLITEFGGDIVKFLGDSVMAYFLDPTETLKSAVRIQQRFQNYNKGKPEQDQIHIRICIHFGEGIVEENDIFGDVVNMAAKLLPLVGSDQIFITEGMHENLTVPPSIRFESLDISGKVDILGKLKVFKVLWDNSVILDPIERTLLYLKPTSSIGRRGFSEIWRNLIKKQIPSYPAKHIIKQRLLSDNSAALIIKDVSASVDMAKDAIKFLKLNLGRDGQHILPVQIIIDNGSYMRAGKIALKDLSIKWGDIEPGEIHISKTAYKALKPGTVLPTTGETVASGNKSFFKLVLEDKEKSKSHAFLYRNSMVRGDYFPCFYCGDKRHSSSECPSKQLTETTNFLEKMGYLSMEEINNHFFRYLNEQVLKDSGGQRSEEWVKSHSPSDWARFAFYELNSLYQLRFFRTIWSVSEENWSKIKERTDGRNKGGLLWICLDCLRVSNYPHMESILRDVLTKNTNDYRVFCVSGFLSVEKGNLPEALAFFKRALECKKTVPQKIFILFLLSRIHHLNGEHMKEKGYLRRILRINPYCPEALYLDIKYRLRYEDRTRALAQLIKLIKANREYYIISLIDPELSSFSEDIQLKIEGLYVEAKDEATAIYPEAKAEVEKMEKSMGMDSKEVSEARSLLKKVEDLLKTEGYFGYLDIIHYGGSLLNMHERIIKGRTMSLTKKLRDVRQQLQKCIVHVKAIRYPFFTRSISYDLEYLQNRIRRVDDKIESHKPDEYEKLVKDMEGVSQELDSIENKLTRLDYFSQFFDFCVAFVKKSLLFQSANFIIGLIILPIMTHYLSFIVPNLTISPQSIWYYQKMFMIFGGISGIIIATLTTKTSASKG